MRGAIAVGAVGLALAAAGPSALATNRAHAARSLPKLATAAPPGYGPAYAVRPHTIWFTGDSTGILGRIAKTVHAVGRRPGFLHWKTWTRRRAYGVGTEWYRSGGGVGAFHRTPVTVTLTDPRDGHFVKMTLRDKFGLDVRCNPPGITFWTIPAHFGSTSCRGAIP
jgi:hypothetical protein